MPQRNRERKERQINVRLTSNEMTDLERIGLREDRNRSYLVSWFTRWGIELYDLHGSLPALRAALEEFSLQKAAVDRLELRKEAQRDLQPSQNPGTERIRKRA